MIRPVSCDSLLIRHDQLMEEASYIRAITHKAETTAAVTSIPTCGWEPEQSTQDECLFRGRGASPKKVTKRNVRENVLAYVTVTMEPSSSAKCKVLLLETLLERKILLYVMAKGSEGLWHLRGLASLLGYE